MLFRTDDPERDFQRDDARKEREIKMLPVCCECREFIDGGYLFDLGDGEVYCEQCAFELFREDVADYVG